MGNQERPEAPGTSPRFKQFDDVPWEEVRKLDFGDHTTSVREKWLDFSPRFLSLYAEWDPGMMIHGHGHNSNHIVYVLDGDMVCGDVYCGTGMHIALDHGDTFGPFVAGPNGVKLFEVMMGDPRSFSSDEEQWAKLLAEKGAQQAPNPPINMPDWLKDTRSEAPE